MGLFARVLASGSGWCVSDVVCTAGPSARPYEEQHHAVCIAAVTAGTFQYRSSLGAATLAPGALLLGNVGHCFECGHEHATGDRCLSFQLAPDYVEAIVAAVPGVRRAGFAIPRLPPLPSVAPLLAAAEAARDDGDTEELEELTVGLVGAIAATLSERGRDERAASPRDIRRVTLALRRIEAEAHHYTASRLALTDLAREAAMSPYHFLRTFRQVVGVTPHQFVLRTRLHRAAVRLLRSYEAISTIVFDTGFNDLSTFNNRFRRVMGMSPSAYRARRSRLHHKTRAG
jgi:AraC family transcriptional regulator